MSDAFRCDECEDYYDGEPHERLYNKRIHDRQGVEHTLRAELCKSCSEDFAGGRDTDNP